MKNVHLRRQVPQPADVFLLHSLHVDVDDASWLGLEMTEYHSAEDHVPDHQTARADRREQEGDELAKIFAAQLLRTAPRDGALVCRRRHRRRRRLGPKVGQLDRPEIEHGRRRRGTTIFSAPLARRRPESRRSVIIT